MTAAIPAMIIVVPIAMPGDFRDAHVAHVSILFVEGLIKTGSPHFGQALQFSLTPVSFSMKTSLMRSFGPADEPTAHIGKH